MSIAKVGTAKVKVVINNCYGGYGLSDLAMRRYFEIKGIQFYPEPLSFGLWSYSIKDPATTEDEDNTFLDHDDIERTDPVLVQVVEELGELANTTFSELRVVTIPDGTDFVIDCYDGKERIVNRYNVLS